MILNFFSLLILVVHTLSLKNPSDATLASMSISIYPRWRPRWRTIIREKMCDTENNVSNPFSFLNCCYEVGIYLNTLACNQIKKNADKMTAKMAVYHKKYKKIFPETDKVQGFACKMLILLILELQTLSL